MKGKLWGITLCSQQLLSYVETNPSIFQKRVELCVVVFGHSSELWEGVGGGGCVDGSSAVLTRPEGARRMGFASVEVIVESWQ